MASLADFDGNGSSSVLPLGWQDVAISNFEPTESKGGNKGVKFTFFNEQTKGSLEDSFWLTDKALWRLASLAQACGLTLEERKVYDPFNMAHHAKLVSRRLRVNVVELPPNDKGKVYRAISDWGPSDAAPIVAPAQPRLKPAESIKPDSEPANDDLPF